MLSGKLARRLLAVGIAVGLLTVLACGSAEEATPTVTPTATAIPALPTVVAEPQATAVPTPTEAMAMGDEPVYGGRIGKPENVITIFDPHNSRAGYGLQLGMVGNLYSQLVRVPLDTRTGVEGDLAESWTVSGDGSEYTFKLREGVVDHDGNPLTAEDIYANMLRYVERINGVSVRRQGCVRNYVAPIYEGDSMAMVANPGAEVIDNNTILIRLVGPRAAFIPCMTGGFVVFHADTYITPIDTDPNEENRDLNPAEGELGGEFGPFKFSSFEIDNFFRVERNENYFRDGLPYLDGIDIYAIPDETPRVAAFKSGRIDTSCTWVCFGKANVDSIVADVPGTVVPHLVTIGYRSYQINTRRTPFGPAGDPDADKLRRAVNLAVDRDVVNKLAFDDIGFLSPPYYVGWDWIYTEDQWREFEGFARNEDKGPEIELAKQLMEELGYGPNNRLKTTTLSGTAGQGLRENEALQSLLDEIYIDVEVIKMDWATRSARLEAFDFDLFSDSVGAPFVDPDAYHTNIFFLFEDGSRNRTGHLPDGWKELHDQQTALQSQDERAPILRQMAQLAIADNFMLGTIRPALQQPHRGNWRNYTPPVLDGSNFSYETLWLDQS
jgi:peptide/nickel transport system substrate-binding protein